MHTAIVHMIIHMIVVGSFATYTLQVVINDETFHLQLRLMASILSAIYWKELKKPSESFICGRQ